MAGVRLVRAGQSGEGGERRDCSESLGTGGTLCVEQELLATGRGRVEAGLATEVWGEVPGGRLTGDGSAGEERPPL